MHSSSAYTEYCVFEFAKMGMRQCHPLQDAKVYQMIAWRGDDCREGTQCHTLLDVDAQAVACHGHAQQLEGAEKRHQLPEAW